VIRLENGFRIYHAGDTAVFTDMQLIAELYEPDLCLLPVGDRFTMGPRDARRRSGSSGRRRDPDALRDLPAADRNPGGPEGGDGGIPGLEIRTLTPGETLG